MGVSISSVREIEPRQHFGRPYQYRFDLKFLVRWDPEYINSNLHLSRDNHFQEICVLNVTTIRVKSKNAR